MLAERLGWAQLTFAGVVKVDVSGNKVEIDRMTDAGVESMSANFPAVLSVIEKINEPRYPSFKGIMASKKKTINTKSLSDVGVAASEVGLATAWSVVDDAAARPPREKGEKVEDAGNGGDKLAEFIFEKRIV
jgi:electron transfer flavoprotein beta subunit